MAALDFTNPLFVSYAFYAAVLVFKSAILSLLTSVARLRTGSFNNPEDVVFALKKGQGKHDSSTESVARVRRAHLNDLENIPYFLILAPLYILTNPSASIAFWHFRLFAIGRIGASICHLVPFPPPSRTIFFALASLVGASVITQIIMHTFMNYSVL
ncbi:microsomal glutathione S-transferase 1-like [Oscarella lobularis]|uniref:microsomal glutathione S-transferase 1-like n=1 Tax=Oscarella lobularis TaxID=121494 RepID=UPI003313BBF8